LRQINSAAWRRRDHRNKASRWPPKKRGRDTRGREIDILAQAGRTLVGFAIKAAATVTAADFRHLRWFAEKGPGAGWNVLGIVIYLGDRVLRFGPRLVALPLSVFWS
jgi:hypothetical protein